MAGDRRQKTKLAWKPCTSKPMPRSTASYDFQHAWSRSRLW